MLNRLILKVSKFQLPPPKRSGTVLKNIWGGPSCPPPTCQIGLRFGALQFDPLHDEFISYQLLSDDEIPPQVIKEATVTSKLKDGKEEKHLRMDAFGDP